MYHWGNGPAGVPYDTPYGYTIADTLGRWGWLTPGYPDSVVCLGGGITASVGMLLGGAHLVPVRRIVTARAGSTVRRFGAGGPIFDPEGKPYVELTAAHGLTLGSVLQLARTDDSLRSAIVILEAEESAIEVLLAPIGAR